MARLGKSLWAFLPSSGCVIRGPRHPESSEAAPTDLGVRQQRVKKVAAVERLGVVGGGGSYVVAGGGWWVVGVGGGGSWWGWLAGSGWWLVLPPVTTCH